MEVVLLMSGPASDVELLSKPGRCNSASCLTPDLLASPSLLLLLTVAARRIGLWLLLMHLELICRTLKALYAQLCAYFGWCNVVLPLHTSEC
jgi:hypothetical protein